MKPRHSNDEEAEGVIARTEYFLMPDNLLVAWSGCVPIGGIEVIPAAPAMSCRNLSRALRLAIMHMVYTTIM